MVVPTDTVNILKPLLWRWGGRYAEMDKAVCLPAVGPGSIPGSASRGQGGLYSTVAVRKRRARLGGKLGCGPKHLSLTLAVDLNGKMTPGINQEQKNCKYLLVGVYTFPVTKSGQPLVDINGVEPQDHLLPDLEGILGEDDIINGEHDDPGQDPLHEGEEEASGSLDAWQRLVEDSQDVMVKNVTFVEAVQSRASQHVLPAVARIYGRLRQLGLPVLRLHSDRA